MPTTGASKVDGVHDDAGGGGRLPPPPIGCVDLAHCVWAVDLANHGA